MKIKIISPTTENRSLLRTVILSNLHLCILTVERSWKLFHTARLKQYGINTTETFLGEYTWLFFIPIQVRETFCLFLIFTCFTLKKHKASWLQMNKSDLLDTKQTDLKQL